MRNRNPILLLFGIMFVIFLSTTIFSVLLNKDLNDGHAPVARFPSVPIQQPTSNVPLPPPPILHTLTPEKNPEKYGIIVHDDWTTPQKQEDWDQYMKQVIVDRKILEEPAAQASLEAVKKSPDDYQKKIKEIDERIATFEERKRNNPSDTEAEERLRLLYMLKAMGKVMVKKVTEPLRPESNFKPSRFPHSEFSLPNNAELP